MKARPSLLLVEPFSVLRHTVVMVAKELALADVVEATSLEGAFQLLRRLRAGAMQSSASTPVAIMTGPCDAGMVQAMKELQISRIVLKPFKVKVILETIAQIIQGPPLLVPQAAAA